MKNLIFVFIGVMLFVFKCNAQETKDFREKYDFKSGSIITRFDKEIIEYKFSSIEDLKESIDGIINEIDFKGTENDNCKITIEVKVELLFGVSITTISESIITSCTNEAVDKITKRFKTMLLATISMG